MTRPSDNHEPMRRSVAARRTRREEWERHGERSLGQNLALIGSLGWLVVVPTLAGVFAGRWLDRAFASGIFWTSALIFLGVVAGCWLAWKRIGEEHRS